MSIVVPHLLLAACAFVRTPSPLAVSLASAKCPLMPRVPCSPVSLAPSGVDGMPYMLQQAVFVSTFIGLASTAWGSAVCYELARRRWGSKWWLFWERWSAFTLGVTFVLAGRSHFTMPEAFKAIYPPLGTWGFWYLPGSSDFHVAWTGVAELLGGSGLLLGCLLSLAGCMDGPLLVARAARAVLALVVCVTPANIFMFTHGATMPGIMDGDLPLGWHAGRFVAQAIVLSVLLTTSEWGPASARAAASDEASDQTSAEALAGPARHERRGRAGRGPRMQVRDGGRGGGQGITPPRRGVRGARAAGQPGEMEKASVYRGHAAPLGCR